MQLSGDQFIGFTTSKKGSDFFHAINPESGEKLPGDYADATAGEIDAAVQASEDAFKMYRKIANHKRALFLDAIADQILALGDDLVARAMAETALPKGRIEGERGRTMGQLKLFAKIVRDGSWVDARIDKAIPDRTPFPRSDIRQMLQPMGPVAIFGASNFPLAFSVAGGDTASALAAGCTVVIKGHPAHPGTSELVFKAILRAAEETGMPDGVASMVHGTSVEVGQQLVSHPMITAVGFTGSHRGGKAIFDAANRREIPIPVFAEMGSTNPVFILPGALQERGEEIASGLAGSVTLGVGQFCTNPGLVILPKDDAGQLTVPLAQKIDEDAGGTMLTAGIRKAFSEGADKLSDTDGVTMLASGNVPSTSTGIGAKIFVTSSEVLASDKDMSKEIFGPSSVLVDVSSKEKMLDVARNLEGHLTATIHGTDNDLQANRELIDILSRKVGRLIINGFPTGVEVCHAIVHGGPYPATTNAQSTSVGTNAIKRFARPICYQDFPDTLLPEALKEENSLGIWRMVDGEFTKN